MHFIGYILAFLIGVFGILALMTSLIIGTMRIDTSNEDGPYLFLMVDEHKMPTLHRSKYVIVRVEEGDFTSQE